VHTNLPIQLDDTILYKQQLCSTAVQMDSAVQHSNLMCTVDTIASYATIAMQKCTHCEHLREGFVKASLVQECLEQYCQWSVQLRPPVVCTRVQHSTKQTNLKRQYVVDSSGGRTHDFEGLNRPVLLQHCLLLLMPQLIVTFRGSKLLTAQTAHVHTRTCH
jgi:hypothetical protein